MRISFLLFIQSNQHAAPPVFTLALPDVKNVKAYAESENERASSGE